MEKTCIFAPNGTPSIGPYSHAVSAGGFLYVSGQCPFAKDGSGAVRGTIAEETTLALENLKAVLRDAGTSLERVVKVTVYLIDMENFAAFNEVYKTYFTENFPARTCIQVARLPLDIQVEIDVIALLSES